MAKFCGNCGTKMEDEAKICKNCGTLYAGYTGYNSNKLLGVNNMFLAKKKTKSIIKLGAILAVFIVAVIITVKIISSHTGHMGALNKAMTAFENYDIETLSSMTSNIGLLNSNPENIEDYVSNSISEKFDEYEKAAGNNIKIHYEIVNASQILGSEYQKILDYFEEYYYYDTSDISKIISVNLKMNIEGSARKTSYSTDDLYLINEGNKWYLFDGYVGSVY